MKRVLFLTHNFTRRNGDISGIFLLDLIQELSKRDVSVTVLAPHEKGLMKVRKIDGVNVYHFCYAPERYENLFYRGDLLQKVRGGLFSKFLFISSIISFIWSSYTLAKSRSFDLLHAHWWVPSGIVALLTSVILRKPYIITTHGTDAFIIKKFQFLKPLAKFVFQRANFITTTSNSIKSILINNLRIIPDKIRVFPMPCDFSSFYPIPVKKNPENTILSVGRLIELKGYDYLIESAKILKESGTVFRLIIIGEGPEEEFLRNKILMLGLTENVIILPFHPKAKLNYFYNLCDVFVLPSIKDTMEREEGLGLVLLEAMACKKPVIGTNSGGIPDIIKDGETGVLVPEKDPEALANAIEKLLKDKKIADKLAENGYKFVKDNFTPSKITDRMLTIYEKVLPKS